MSNKSFLDVAYEVIKSNNGPINFLNLWNSVCEKTENDPSSKEGKIGKFYTLLLTDGRFVNLGDNTWDLRDNYTFDKVHIDMSDCYSDEEDDDKDPEDLLVEKDDDEMYKEDDDEEESDYEPEEDSEDDL